VVLNRLRLPSRPHREHGALIQFSMRNVLKIFRWAWILFFFCGGLHSQVESRNRRPSSVPTRSRSGQFIVLGESSIKEDLSRNSVLVPGGPQRTVSLTPLRPMDSQGIANLTPALLSVSCERIKGELLRVLKIEDRFNGSIVVRILPEVSRLPPARIFATQYADGWRYTLEFQERVHWTLLVRTTVEALLLEIANRGNPNQLNPIPLWLSEGITTLLIGESSRELVPQMNREFKDLSRSMDPLVAIAAKTSGRSPLGFDVMAFPSDSLTSNTNLFQLFQGSSALLVHHLRLLGRGGGSLGSLVFSFNQSLNWQTGFLKTYQAEFQSLLEVEKWWAVQASAFYVQNASRDISTETIDRFLRSILQENVEVARSTNSPVGRRLLRLSDTIEQWPFAAQLPVLERKMTQLRHLSVLGSRYFSRRNSAAVDPELRTRFDQVRRLMDVLDPYLRERSNSGNLVKRGDVDPRIRVLVQVTTERLRLMEQEILGSP